MSTITGLGLILLVLMVIIGGKQGLQSFISLILNFGFLFFSIVLIAFHFPPLIVTLVTGVIILALTIFLSGTSDSTSQIAFVASLVVLGLLVLLIIPVEHWAQVQGFGLEDSDDLEGMSILVGIDYVQVAITTAILSTLGAIAEATMAIASGLDEIIEQHPHIQAKRLFMDGVLVGKQIIGTTLNTLFFGLFGGSLSLFIWFAGLHYSAGSIVNDKVFAGQFVIILFSLIGVIITIPVTSLIMAQQHQSRQNQKGKVDRND
ncbi:YibE/F family protein [Lactobacillus sp. Sy-1]|uniref:YibE/F family protein n=1 Tax=Lactobacillus sp. Sy-1 TaxID=2109645 RepID=UPI001C56ACE0|nr:YibE/F family protein [Lactobacillus sp. Sy-1]MBW1605217.1 YibE/F family protein [Lactobacillus sp. Sy-1]